MVSSSQIKLWSYYNGCYTASICKIVNTEEIQLGFAPGKGTNGANFFVYGLQEKYITANKQLYAATLRLYLG